MGTTAERTLLSSVADLDAGGPAPETAGRALRALVELTHARFGRAEIMTRGESRPLVLARFGAGASETAMRAIADEEVPLLGSTSADSVVEVLDTGTVAVRTDAGDGALRTSRTTTVRAGAPRRVSPY